MQTAEIRILLVDDEPAHLELITRVLQTSGLPCQITAAESLTAARQHLADDPVYDVALVDLQLPDGNGIELLQNNSEAAHLPIIVMTSHGSEEIAVDALKLGARDYVVKSSDRLRDVGQIVQRVLREQTLIRERAAAEAALAHSHDLLAGLIDSLELRIAVLDEQGAVVIANELWKQPSPHNPLASCDVGENYLAFCSSLVEHDLTEAAVVLGGVRSVMEGWRADSRHEYEVAAPEGRLWFETRVVKFHGAQPARVVVTHEDVTSRKLQELEAQRRVVAQAKLSLLSRREREVLDLVVLGLPNKVVARRLELSEKTVEKHRASVMKKLSLQSVPELVRLAMHAEETYIPAEEA